MAKQGELREYPGLFCPQCNGDLRFVIRQRGTERGPLPGDSTVCSHCLAYLKYSSDGEGGLRLDHMSDHEFERLPEKDQGGLMQVRAELEHRRSKGEKRQPTQFEAALAHEVNNIKQVLIGTVSASMELRARACGCAYCRGGDWFNCVRGRVVQ